MQVNGEAKFEWPTIYQTDYSIYKQTNLPLILINDTKDEIFICSIHLCLKVDMFLSVLILELDYPWIQLVDNLYPFYKKQ